RKRHRLRFAYKAAGVVVLALLACLFIPPVQDFAQTVIRIATNKGVLEIEAEDEDIEVTIKQPGKNPIVQVIHKKTKETFELTAVGGEIITRLPAHPGLDLKGKEFQLSRGGRVYFSARDLVQPLAAVIPYVERTFLTPRADDYDELQGEWVGVRGEFQLEPIPDPA